MSKVGAAGCTAAARGLHARYRLCLPPPPPLGWRGEARPPPTHCLSHPQPLPPTHLPQTTFEFHYGKHHAAYLNNLNGQVAGKDLEKLTIEEVRACCRCAGVRPTRGSRSKVLQGAWTAQAVNRGAAAGAGSAAARQLSSCACRRRRGRRRVAPVPRLARARRPAPATRPPPRRRSC